MVASTISVMTSRVAPFAIALLLAGCATKDHPLAPTSLSTESPGGIGAKRPDIDAAAALQYQVLPFDVPASMGDFTSAFGINDAGVITGNYAAPDGSAHGFVFRGGAFTDVVVPGAGPSDLGSLGDVNNSGTAVGTTSDVDDVSHMFLRKADGTTAPLPDALPGGSTDPLGINDLGSISGTVFDAGGTHGFIFRGGTFTIYDHPGAVRTRLFGMNNRGQVAGFWSDGAGVRHGFVLTGSTETPVEVPGALGTAAAGINDRGQVVGFYTGADHVVHGCLLTRGTVTTIDFPGSSDTRLTAINNAGVIVGTYDFFSRGMVAIPAAP